MRLVVASIFVVIGLLFTGCASLLDYTQKPQVSLQSVRASDVTLTGAKLIFTLKVENPNKRDIELSQVAYKIFLSGKEFSQAQTQEKIVIPAEGIQQVELPLPVKFSEVLDGVGSLLASRQIGYRIEGEAKALIFSIPFSKEGKVELR